MAKHQLVCIDMYILINDFTEYIYTYNNTFWCASFGMLKLKHNVRIYYIHPYKPLQLIMTYMME